MKKILVLLFIFVFTSQGNSWGWWDKTTHRILSETAARGFFDSDFMATDLMSGTLTQPASKWIEDGSTLEDQANWLGVPTRSLNHFHDPTKPLAQAGLDDTFTGMSAIIWGQDPADQRNTTGGDWSWQRVRDHQYSYLVSLSKAEEDNYLSQLLKGLGYQMHLLQDMSQPNHVRNDTHVSDGMGRKKTNGFETWAKDDKTIRRILATASAKEIANSVAVATTSSYEGGRVPVARLYDTRDNLKLDISVTPNIPYILPSAAFTQGLAEYTNSNFFSEDSIFSAERFVFGNGHYFPYPKKAETDLQDFISKDLPTIPKFDFDKTYESFYISKKKTTGQQINYFAVPTAHTDDYYRVLGEGKYFYDSFVQNEDCFEEQAGFLLPRAVGYSKGMLDYFFRGDLTVTVPSDTPPTNSHIRLNVRNSTSTGETMNGGSIELMVIFRQYKEQGMAPSGTLVADGDYQFRKYPLGNCTGSNAACTIDTKDTLLDFDLSDNPIPPLARDISLIVIYRGKLGYEADSIAYEEIYLDDLEGDLDLGLPERGVYASVNGESIASTFANFALTARKKTPTPTAPGYAELVITYRDAVDPFQPQPVGASTDIKYVSATVNTPNGISPYASTELLYTLAAGIPIKATDIHVYLIHTDNNAVVTYGVRDVSEPTPVDVYNNTDYTCLKGKWYRYDDPLAMTIVDSNGDHIADKSDIYPHTIWDISFQAGPANAASLTASPEQNNLFSAGPLPPGHMLRLGYILTDYTNKFAFDEEWQNLFLDDIWIAESSLTTFPGTGFTNQDNRGTAAMYTIRGSKMWWGASVVYLNPNYDGECDQALLPPPAAP